MTLAVRIAALVDVFDAVAKDGEAMEAASEQFQDILQVRGQGHGLLAITALHALLTALGRHVWLPCRAGRHRSGDACR